MNDPETLKKAAAWIRREMKTRWQHGHPSHELALLLEEAEARYELQSLGVEGWANASGSLGVQYLNTGDPYGLTLVARSRPHTWSLSVGCWASALGFCS